MKRLRPAVKRLMDIVGALVGLLVLSPLMIVAAVLVRATMGRPVLFRQTRPGRNERPFTLYKFRTMTDERGPGGELLPDGERLTRLGRLMRRFSLDELPQLWNVLRGDMSLVGPRPLLMEYLERYTPEQRRRHQVRPGITGWAQVKGRNELDWKERLQMDARYVDRWNLWVDLWILALTVSGVFAGRGVSRGGCATMPEFTGDNSSNGSMA